MRRAQASGDEDEGASLSAKRLTPIKAGECHAARRSRGEMSLSSAPIHSCLYLLLFIMFIIAQGCMYKDPDLDKSSIDPMFLLGLPMRCEGD